MTRTVAGLSCVTLIVCVMLSVGCEKRRTARTTNGTSTSSSGDGATTGTAAPEAVRKKPWPSETGSIVGVVKVAGNTPPMPVLDMSAKPDCLTLHDATRPTSELIVRGADGGLRDVFVYVAKGLEGYDSPPVGTESVTIDQKGCVYIPHVFGVRVDQDLRLVNSDALLHSVKVNENRPMNDAMAGVGERIKKRWFRKAQLGISFQCEMHPWMKAYACVVDHPCYAVTDIEGKFGIENVPPGKYSVDFWHERAPGIKTPDPVEVEVKAGEEARVEVSF